MTHRVVLTTQADCQLEDAAAWWAEHRSPGQAARWYAGFSEAIAALAQNPERCPLVQASCGSGGELDGGSRTPRPTRVSA